MAKKRVHEIAKEMGMSSKDVLAVLQAAGVQAKAAASSVDEEEIKKAFAAAKSGNGAAEKAPAKKAAEPKAEAPAEPKAEAKQPEAEAKQPVQRPVRNEG